MSSDCASDGMTDGAARFLCDRLGADDPILAVRKAVAQLFTGCRLGVPVDLEVLLRNRAIRRVVNGHEGREAVLVPVPHGFEMRVSGDTRFRLFDSERRFTLAHEIIETFFFSYDSPVPVHWSRLSGYRVQATPRAMGPDGSEERLCDYGAGLALIPMHVMDDLTSGGETIPEYARLVAAARACQVGQLNLTHRIASYLAVKHSSHAMVALVKKCEDPNDVSREAPKWRLWPVKRRGGHPVAIDIGTSLKHQLYISTNMSLRKLGLNALAEWLDSHAHDVDESSLKRAEECGLHKQRGVVVRLTPRQVSFDAKHQIGVAWLDLAFSCKGRPESGEAGGRRT